MNKIEIKNLSFRYQTPEKEVEALRDISFDVEEKNFCSLVGPSGCGKSTILSAMAGLLQVQEGNIRIVPENNKVPKVGLMPQDNQLFEWCNIWDNVTIGLKISHQYDSNHKKIVEELLEKYGLFEYKDMRPNELSGGMQQRCSLIRTLAINPDILLLDEPFSALDYQTRIEVSQDIQSIIKEQGKTAILVTHDIREAVNLSDKIVVLSKRPAQVVGEFDMKELKDIRPQERGELPQFQKIYNAIWSKMSDYKIGGE